MKHKSWMEFQKHDTIVFFPTRGNPLSSHNDGDFKWNLEFQKLRICIYRSCATQSVTIRIWIAKWVKMAYWRWVIKWFEEERINLSDKLLYELNSLY